MWAILYVFAKCVLFLPLVAIHLVISFLVARPGDVNWGLDHSIRDTARWLFDEVP